MMTKTDLKNNFINEEKVVLELANSIKDEGASKIICKKTGIRFDRVWRILQKQSSIESKEDYQLRSAAITKKLNDDYSFEYGKPFSAEAESLLNEKLEEWWNLLLYEEKRIVFKSIRQ